MSWIGITDAVRAMHLIMTDERFHGPVNMVHPQCVTQAEFARTLGRVLSRPVPFDIPAFALRIIFGSGLAEVLLAGQRVIPVKLTDANFRFSQPDLLAALREILPVAGSKAH
jgi:NAD dependent epimerase/dehydratase family enzyme